MKRSHGFLTGFLIGAVMALAAAGVTVYALYTGIQERLSPETLRTTAERKITEWSQGKASVGKARVDWGGGLSLEGVSISDGTRSLLTLGTLELIAEGGVRDLEQGKVSRIVLTDTVLNLRRSEGTWNWEQWLETLTQPQATLTGSLAAPPNGDEETVTSVELNNFELMVGLDNETAYTALKVDHLIGSRDKLDAPWDLSMSGIEAHLNPSENEWPLLTAYETAKASLATAAAGEGRVESAGDTEPWLRSLAFEDVYLALDHPRQTLAIDSFSGNMEDFMQVWTLQIGRIAEKKTPPTRS